MFNRRLTLQGERFSRVTGWNRGGGRCRTARRERRVRVKKKRRQKLSAQRAWRGDCKAQWSKMRKRLPGKPGATSPPENPMDTSVSKRPPEKPGEYVAGKVGFSVSVKPPQGDLLVLTEASG